jgi:nucleotide-binding universal stress UspA family protein
MTVLVGYIPTTEGLRALRLAGEEAHLRSQGLVVVNVHRDDRPSDVRIVEEDDEHLERVRRDLAARGTPVEVAVPHGVDPAEALMQEARDRDASVIVIGLRHRSAVGKLLLGSTAMKILMHAPCPVLTVRVDAG